MAVIKYENNINKITGTIFNIQRYSIHDGPGIRTTVFIKGCPLRCFWCQNPESQKEEPEIFLKKEMCTVCGLCVDVCPKKAISLSSESSLIDRRICIGCGKCAEICPNEARKLIGRHVTVNDVIYELLKDMKFYKKSGGGVTISGGDPIDQPNFVIGLLKGCKEEGLHTAIQTSGFTSWEIMSNILEYTDFVMYDIKCIGEKKHYLGTKTSNRIILENAKKIYKSKKEMLIRVPLVPGYNDTIQEIRAIEKFVVSELKGTRIELLAYNKLGESKYKYLDREPFQGETQSEEIIKALKSIFVKEIASRNSQGDRIEPVY
jgi:pyruvate formate lyase activating enzyme